MSTIPSSVPSQSSAIGPDDPAVVTTTSSSYSAGRSTSFEYTTVTEYTSFVPTTDENGAATSVLAVVEQTILLSSSPAPSSTENSAGSTYTSSSSTSTSTGILGISSKELWVDSTFTTWTYFAALYLAPILAVAIKALYEVVIASLKMVEPFQRMAHPAGATATYSILAQYLSSSISLDAFRAMAYGHLLPFWSTLMYALVEVGAPVASAAMNVRSRSTCLVDGTERKCDPVWVVNIVIVRCVEAILALCLLLILFLIFSTWRYYIPVASNPSSIISLATLLNHDSLLHELQRIDPDASDEVFQAALERHLFWLDDHEHLLTHHQHYGIIGYRYSEYRRGMPHIFDRFRHSRDSLVVDYVPVTDPAQQQTRSSSLSIRTQKRLFPTIGRKLVVCSADILQLLTTLALLALVLAYTFDPRVDSFNNFFNSQKILPKIIFVGLATVVDAQMKRLERNIRITEPYRRLSLGDAIPQTTILMPLNGTCWSNLPRCIFYVLRYPGQHMEWQTVVSIAASLGDLNIIAVAGLLFNEAQTTEAFQICAYVAIAFTAAMLIVSLLSVLWWRRVSVIKEMPRRPDTIGAVLSYLCGSMMVRDWTIGMEMEKMSEKARDRFIVNSNRSFCFGKMVGVDDRIRWCVDFERDEER